MQCGAMHCHHSGPTVCHQYASPLHAPRRRPSARTRKTACLTTLMTTERDARLGARPSIPLLTKLDQKIRFYFVGRLAGVVVLHDCGWSFIPPARASRLSRPRATKLLHRSARTDRASILCTPSTALEQTRRLLTAMSSKHQTAPGKH